MAKRHQSFEDSWEKKTKLEGLNDVWGDDFDTDELDDVVRRATQEVHEQSTILPSYGGFVKPSSVFTSTQSELIQRYEEKEGEVSILRANLTELRYSSQKEQENKEREWKEKCNAAVNESKSFKSQLEFKNLEIANLNRKISELNKIVRQVNIDSNTSQSPLRRPSCDEERSEEIIPGTRDYRAILTASYQYFPYKHSPNKDSWRDPLNFIPTSSAINKETRKNLERIYPEILSVTEMSVQQIASDEFVATAIEIFQVLSQLLVGFHKFLNDVEQNLRLQEIEEIDSLYLRNDDFSALNNPSYINNRTFSCTSGHILSFIANAMPFNVTLCKYLFKERDEDLLRVMQSNGMTEFKDIGYVSLITSIAAAIGRTRRAKFSTDFLSGLLDLIANSLNDESCDSDVVKQLSLLIKKILLSRPERQIVFKTAGFFKVAGGFHSFVNCLCTNVDKCLNSPDTTKGILYLTQDICLFSLFQILLDIAMHQTETNETCLDVGVDVLGIILNIFGSNPSWICPKTQNKCDCLFKVYKLAIETVYRILVNYKESEIDDRLQYSNFFKNSIEVLSLLHFHSFDFIEKYLPSFGKFKEIVSSLLFLRDELSLDEDHVSNLDKMNMHEDVSFSSCAEKFAEIDL